MMKDTTRPRYSIFLDELPYRLNEKTRSVIFHMARVIQEADLPQIDFVVSLPATKWQGKSSYLNMYVVGSFRKSYPLIVELSRVLAEPYLEHLVLPVLYPLPLRIWEHHAEARTELLHAVRGNGLLLFQKRRNFYDIGK